MPTPELLPLLAFALLAGFVDSVVGGGGLIQVPALFVLLPQVPAATLLGTNKFAGIWGTTFATVQYMRHVQMEWRATLPTCAAALAFGYVGAQTVASLDPALLRPMILAMLVAVLAYTIWKKDLGKLHAPRLNPGQQFWVGLATGGAIGFYDGFFGPGTGSFLIFAFVGLFGFSFLAASASAKIVNVTTNLAAIGYFALNSHVLYAVALPMAVFNIAGAAIGSRLAIKKGSGFVRALFLAVVGALIVRYAWDLEPVM
ncbi:MAG: TSUP family transporter [Gammaproteobacteria bacterium]|nr:TSUP family transporter [Gammaproteobacteria bacterium]